MRRRTLFVVCLLTAIFVCGQNLSPGAKEKDKYLNTRHGTTYKTGVPTSKKKTANNSITDLKTYTNGHLLKEASAYIGKKNDMDSALMCYSIVYKRYADDKETVDDDMLTKTLSGLWYIYFFHYYDYMKSNEILKESLNVCKARSLNSSWVYLDFGFMYQMIAEQSLEQSLYSKALSHYKAAFHEARKIKDWGVMLNAFGNIIVVSAELHNLQSLHHELSVFKQIPRSFNALEYKYDSLLYAGALALERNKAEAARKCFSEQLALFKQLSHEYSRYVYLAHINLAKAYCLRKDYEMALHELKAGERISADFETKDTKLEAYKLLYETYAKVGDNRQAADYQSKYIMLKDSLLNYRLIAGVNEMEFENKMKDVTYHLKQLEHQKEMQRIVIFLFMTIGCIVAISLFVVASKNKKLNQSNKALFRKNIELFQSEEKERMRRKALEEHFVEGKTARKYKSSTLSEERKEELLQKILTLMDNNDCIFSYDFSANQLASEIGNSVGFKSRSSFIAAFKQVTGLTPIDFQRNVDAK